MSVPQKDLVADEAQGKTAPEASFWVARHTILVQVSSSSETLKQHAEKAAKQCKLPAPHHINLPQEVSSTICRKNARDFLH